MGGVLWCGVGVGRGHWSLISVVWMIVGVVQTCRQNKNQPEREFLENGENPQIRKIRNDKQDQNYPNIPPKEKKVRKVETNTIRTKPRKQKHARRGKGWSCPFKMCNQWRRRQEQAKQKNSWLCGIGAILCHAMLCMHVEYRRLCRADGMHQNIVVA